VSVISEGFDAPSVSCVVLLRPTRSRGLYVQQVGRGLRSFGAGAAAKRDCLVLDFAESTMRHGPVTRPIESVLDLPRDDAADSGSAGSGAGSGAGAGTSAAAAASGGGKSRCAGRAWVCADEACSAMMHPACPVCALCGAPREAAAPLPRGKARAGKNAGAGAGAGKAAAPPTMAAAPTAAPRRALPAVLSPPHISLVIPRFREPARDDEGGDKGEGGLGALAAAMSGMRLAGGASSAAELPPPPLQPAPTAQRAPEPRR